MYILIILWNMWVYGGACYIVTYIYIYILYLHSEYKFEFDRCLIVVDKRERQRQMCFHINNATHNGYGSNMAHHVPPKPGYRRRSCRPVKPWRAN